MNTSWNRITFILLFIFISFTGLYSMGRADDSEAEKVSGLENWEHDIDVSDLPPGEYNIIVRGTDRAGNTGVGGPFNVFIDPSIEIPQAAITSPAAGSRVGDLVNVVGTAIDDIEVARVEISVDEGNYQPAEGTAFWSTILDSSSWDDGLHTIKVRAWDADRNESSAAEVSFYKDTVKPVIEIQSHENGSYISGRIKLEGTIRDLNGVSDAKFTAGSGEEPEALRLSKTKEDGLWSFSRKIDTREFEDGAHVYRIEAVDGLGSNSKQSFLYYIDNSPPELSLLSPTDEDLVNGLITLIGVAEDSVGLTGLSYEADNGDFGEVELSPGNPVWTLPLDYSGFKGKEARVSLVLTDLVGNSVSETLKIPLDKSGDMPLPGLSGNLPAEGFTGVPVITGMIQDDDGSTGRIEYSLNKSEWTSFDVDGPWILSLDDAVYGQNSLSIRAVDSSDVTGEPADIIFFLKQPESVILIESYMVNEESSPWFPGAVLDAKNPGLISGRFSGPESISKLSYSINNEEPGSLSLNSLPEKNIKTFDLKLPKNLPSGKIALEIFGIDDTGSSFSAETVYYNYLQPKVEEGAELPEYKIPDSKDLHLILPDASVAGFILLNSGRQISGWSSDAEIKSVELSEGEDFLSVSKSSHAFHLAAKSQGRADSVVITVKLKDGTELSSKPLKLAADSISPKIKVEKVAAGMITGDDLSLSAGVTDNTGEHKLYYSFDGGGSFTELSPDSGDDGLSVGTYSSVLSVPGADEQLVDLILKAEDSFGNVSQVNLPLLKDTAAPELDFITSSFERGAEQLTFSGRIKDGDRVDTLKVNFLPAAAEIDAEAEFDANLNGDIFYIDTNITTLGFEPADVLLTAVDRAGNKTEKKLKLNIDLNEGRPLVGIQVPAEADSFETGFNLSGLILDKEGVKSIQYNLNDSGWIEAGNGNIFTVPLQLSQMLDDRNTIGVKAVDVNGLESEAVSRGFIVSLEPPELGVNYPDLDAVVRGKILLEGVASDVNGIKAVYVSHDNGNTFQKADGQEDWSYMLDTRLFSDGVSSLLLKAEDDAGIYGYYTTLINVDNTVPSISLTHPKDGEELRGTLSVSGRLVDNSRISTLKAYISRLDGSAEESVYELKSRGIIREDIELEDFNPGAYSFRLEAVDDAANKSTVSKVVSFLPGDIRPPMILSPLPGEQLGPRFSIQGYLPDPEAKALILVNDEIFDTVEVSSDGYFRRDISPEDDFPQGENRIAIKIGSDENSLTSENITVIYHAEGLWAVFDNIANDQFASDRFTIEGSAGYESDFENPDVLADLQPKNVSLSLDGGSTFEQIRLKDGLWKYTLYTEEIPDGELHLLLSVSSGEESSFSRCRIIMDTENPELKLFEPAENRRLFGSISLSGGASDNDELTDVSLSFREGDKDNYETPSFIQGMYFDASGLGATYFTTGLGLTFMDDNVKLQLQYGYAPTTVIDPETNLEYSARFGGNVFGGKLLANLAQVPFSWLLGPEFSAFSATAALGANFSYFSSNTADNEDSWGVILAGLVGQVELPKVSFEDRAFLKYASVYWEGQLWLISSDVSPEVVLLPSIGIRLGLF